MPLPAKLGQHVAGKPCSQDGDRDRDALRPGCFHTGKGDQKVLLESQCGATPACSQPGGRRGCGGERVRHGEKSHGPPGRAAAAREWGQQPGTHLELPNIATRFSSPRPGHPGKCCPSVPKKCLSLTGPGGGPGSQEPRKTQRGASEEATCKVAGPRTHRTPDVTLEKTEGKVATGDRSGVQTQKTRQPHGVAAAQDTGTGWMEDRDGCLLHCGQAVAADLVGWPRPAMASKATLGPPSLL